MKNMKVFVLSVIGVLLLCSVASAIEVTPYFKISREYGANPFRAQKEWMGKEICIEGKIEAMGVTDNGGAIIALSDGNDGLDRGARYSQVGYFFMFDGVSNELMSLEEGQWVRLSGKVNKINTPSKGNNMFIIALTYAKVAN